MTWLDRHNAAIQAAGTIVTALAALAALILIPVQIAGADRIQREQAARDIYRDFLNLTVQRPDVALTDPCIAPDTAAGVAYAAYVEHLLYTGEQVLSVSEDWSAAIAVHLSAHAPYLCGFSDADLSLYDPALAALIRQTRGTCPKAAQCR